MERICSIFVIFFVTFFYGYSQNTLFKKYEGNPIIRVGSGIPDWRAIHVANAAILKPEESPDGTWRVYIRGSGNTPDYHDQIGILYQDTTVFSPYGPWLEYEDNPVLKFGIPGSYDEWHLLDCSPVIGENGDVYFYYKAVNYNHASSMAGAKSTDGGYTFEKFSTNPLKLDVGSNDAIYHNEQYYIYYGDALYNRVTHGFDAKLEIYLKITSDPTYLKDCDSIKVIPVGGGPGNFDSEAVNGGRIFRLDNMWFMIYQGSDHHFDFPDRFHAAYSDDLIHWTKVDNDFPMMTRGPWGEWDQGAIWYGEVFEYRDTLYMLYEGWGCYCIPEDRDVPYFPGNSRTGIAQVPVEDFLYWVDGGFDSSWVSCDFGSDGMIADFENYTPVFHPTNNLFYQVVDNPHPDDVNSSAHVGKIITTADKWELLWSEPFATRFDFSKGSTFTMKVYSEVAGNVHLKLEHPTNYNLGQTEVIKELTTTGEWVNMEFDFSSKKPKSDLYGKIVLLFDGGGTYEGNEWYFDDIKQTSLTSSASSLQAPTAVKKNLRLQYDPAHERIILDNIAQNEDYTIYSVTGTVIKKGSGNSIDISDLQKGIYIVSVRGLSSKFIK